MPLDDSVVVPERRSVWRGANAGHPQSRGAVAPKSEPRIAVELSVRHQGAFTDRLASRGPEFVDAPAVFGLLPKNQGCRQKRSATPRTGAARPQKTPAGRRIVAPRAGRARSPRAARPRRSVSSGPGVYAANSTNPTAAPTVTDAPTTTNAPTRTETYAPTRMTEAPSYAPTTDTYALTQRSASLLGMPRTLRISALFVARNLASMLMKTTIFICVSRGTRRGSQKKTENPSRS